MCHVLIIGLINKYKNAKFTEYIITHDANNPLKTEEGDTFYFGEGVSRTTNTNNKKRNNLCKK